jgi:hypothetical protein
LHGSTTILLRIVEDLDRRRVRLIMLSMGASRSILAARPGS